MKKLILPLLVLIMLISVSSCSKGKEINLSYEQDKIEIYVGEKISVKPNVELGSKVKDYSLDYELSEDIARVDNDGMLTARESGTTTLTVTADNKDQSSATLVIVIKDIEYTITMDVNGGSMSEEAEIIFTDKDDVELPVPTREGHNFLGWFEEGVLVTRITEKDYNLVANWEAHEYTITLNADGGTLDSETVIFKHGETVTLPVPTKEGYEFAGWYEGDVLVENVSNKHYTLQAKWNVIEYTITLDANGGSVAPTKVRFEYNQTVTLPTPTYDGHKFVGWYENDVLVETIENKDYTLVAKWVVEYNISYSAKGAKMPANVVKTFTDGSTVELPIPTKEGYNFVGWYENDVLVEVLENRDYKLVAKFEEIDDGIYDITYKFTEGSWYVKSITTRAQVVDELYADLYEWAKLNGETASFEDYKVAVLEKFKNGEDINLLDPVLMDKENTKGETTYFINTTKYFNKWVDFFLKVREIVLKKNTSEDIFKDNASLMDRMYSYIVWNSKGSQMFLSYQSALCKTIHVKADVKYEYAIGDSFDLIPLVHDLDLDFLGWYDNPELTGEPVTAILPTDKGNKTFYPKFEEEVMPNQILVDVIPDLLRFTSHQLTWSFDPIDTTNKAVSFYSTNRNVATINDEGLINAIADGKTTICVYVLADRTKDFSFELEVYSPDQVIGSYETNSYVSVNEDIVLLAELLGRNVTSIVWESLDESIAVVNEEGRVTGLEEGVVTIVAKDKENEDIRLEFIVTVVSDETSELIKFVTESHNSNIFTEYHLGIGAGTPSYYKDIFGSVSKLLMNEKLNVNDKFHSQATSSGKDSGKQETTEFVTVHYTGNMSSGADAEANANYFSTALDYQASIHYCTGNDGVFYCTDESLAAWHAGDSGSISVVGEFKWMDTGVMVSEGDPMYPEFTISDDFYYEINGKKTSIKMPSPWNYNGRNTNHVMNEDGTLSSAPGYSSPFKNRAPETFINDMALPFKVVDGKYYMGTTWWAYSQVAEGRICSTGGNYNSIGIESCVNQYSDLWYTWQITAQLVADIMDRHNLDITRVRGHHFFTAKDCPQPMLENNLEIWWEFLALVEAEYKLITEFEGYEITGVSNNTTYLKDNGRITKQPDECTCVSYTITISNGETTETITLGSMIEGIYTK